MLQHTQCLTIYSKDPAQESSAKTRMSKSRTTDTEGRRQEQWEKHVVQFSGFLQCFIPFLFNNYAGQKKEYRSRIWPWSVRNRTWKSLVHLPRETLYTLLALKYNSATVTSKIMGLWEAYIVSILLGSGELNSTENKDVRIWKSTLTLQIALISLLSKVW